MIFVNCDNCFENTVVCMLYVLVTIFDQKVKIITFYVIFVIIVLLTLLWNLRLLFNGFYLIEKSYPPNS